MQHSMIYSSEAEGVASGPHPNLLQMSHSSDVLLHACPRRYELYKLSPRADEEENVDTIFGHAVGFGVQRYFETNDRDRSILATYLSWSASFDDTQDRNPKKTLWHAINAVDTFRGVRNTYFGQYELAYFDGKPATELGFSIDLGDGCFYRGFLDVLLRHRLSGEFGVEENKTTKFRTINEAQYRNSGQALGYSIIIDAVAAKLGISISEAYKVHYAIWKSAGGDTGRGEWEMMPFEKNHTSRALWIKNLLIDKAHIMEYASDGYFPMHGESCYGFFRVCPYFGICEMSNRALVGETVPVKYEPDDKYQFKFKLEDVIAAQLARAGG